MATTKKAPAKTAAPAAAAAAPAPVKAPKVSKKIAAPEVVAVPAVPAAPAAKKRTPNAAFMKPLTPSAELAAVVGAAPLPRTEIISKLWVYIKEHNLQDAANKRNINADAKLKKIFGAPQVSMFQLAGLIGKHVS